MANLIIEPDGPDRARSTSCVIVFQQTAEFPLQPIIGGDYEDRLQKIDGHWRFVERRIRNDHIGDLSAHGRYHFDGAADASAKS
jgi:hypothetical protein